MFLYEDLINLYLVRVRLAFLILGDGAFTVLPALTHS